MATTFYRLTCLFWVSKLYSLRSKQNVPASLEEVWSFFSDARNLMQITPPSLNLKVTNEVFGTEVYAGQIITYTVKPLLGIPLHWMTEITNVYPRKYFVDEQRKGPYRFWHHQHHFTKIESGVEVIDIVHYRLPFGIIGNMVNSIVVQKKLKEIFSYRYQKIEERFGKRNGAEIELKMQ